MGKSEIWILKSFIPSLTSSLIYLLLVFDILPFFSPQMVSFDQKASAALSKKDK